MRTYRVSFETGPTAADCLEVDVTTFSGREAEEIILSRYPRAMITLINEVKGDTMTQNTINAVNAQTARRATDKARSLDGDYKRAETTKILENVQAAAAKGQDSVQAGMIDEVVKLRLQNLGFKVVWTNGYDQRDPGYTTISW